MISRSVGTAARRGGSPCWRAWRWPVAVATDPHRRCAHAGLGHQRLGPGPADGLGDVHGAPGRELGLKRTVPSISGASQCVRPMRHPSSRCVDEHFDLDRPAPPCDGLLHRFALTQSLEREVDTVGHGRGRAVLGEKGRTRPSRADASRREERRARVGLPGTDDERRRNSPGSWKRMASMVRKGRAPGASCGEAAARSACCSERSSRGPSPARSMVACGSHRSGKLGGGPRAVAARKGVRGAGAGGQWARRCRPYQARSARRGRARRRRPRPGAGLGLDRLRGAGTACPERGMGRARAEAVAALGLR